MKPAPPSPFLYETKKRPPFIFSNEGYSKPFLCDFTILILDHFSKSSYNIKTLISHFIQNLGTKNCYMNVLYNRTIQLTKLKILIFIFNNPEIVFKI